MFNVAWDYIEAQLARAAKHRERKAEQACEAARINRHVLRETDEALAEVDEAVMKMVDEDHRKCDNCGACLTCGEACRADGKCEPWS